MVVILFGGIIVADKLGWWQTKSSKQPMKIEKGEFEGMPNPDDIRGSYAFGDIEKAFGVSSMTIAEAFG